LGFGNKSKAEEMLKKALEVNPAAIDANFFYGEFLIENDRTAEGIAHLEKALQAAPRPGRHIADTGRREEIRVLLAKARSK
jgi:Tfp pilus assembly protein PilF